MKRFPAMLLMWLLPCLGLCPSRAEEIVVEKRPHTAEWRFDTTVIPSDPARRIHAPAQDVQGQLRIAEVLAHGAATDPATPLLRLAPPAQPADVPSPGTGTFYHGYVSAGRWITPSGQPQLEPGTLLTSGQPIATWAPQGCRMELAAAVRSSSLAGLETGTTGAAIVLSNPLRALPVSVTSIASTPLPDGTTVVRLGFSAPPPNPLHPGTVLPVRLAAKKSPAIFLPVRALRWNSGTWLVAIRLADGKTAQRAVMLGSMAADQVEVTQGLEIGQVVVIQPRTSSSP